MSDGAEGNGQCSVLNVNFGHSRQHFQGDHFSEEPGNVREFDGCQGKDGELTKSWELTKSRRIDQKSGN